MTAEYLSGLPSAVARVDCSGARHGIRWTGGDLVALDHDDPEGERALAALGGTSCTCVDVLEAWSRQRANPALLTVLSRGTQDPIQAEGVPGGAFAPGLRMMSQRNMVMPARTRYQARGSWVSATGTSGGLIATSSPGGVVASHADAEQTSEDDLALLAGLGHELTLRLVSTVTAVLLDGPDGPDRPPARPALEASLLGRASSALRAWLAIPDLEVDLRVTGPDEEPGLEWDGRGSVQLALPLEWVMTVWGRDLTVIAGRFSLGVLESTGTRTALSTIGSDLGEPRQLVVELL
jgi:hypothetical protein